MSSSKHVSTTENGSDRSNGTRDEETKGEPIDGSNDDGELDKKFLPTLPRKFKSLLGTLINVESETPQDLIELLGNALEITDYATNMASFWFLDTLALEILRHNKDLDGYYLSVLVSWLAGEIILLRERKHSREEFFREMKEIFNVAANKISERNRLLYWDEIVYDAEKLQEEENHSISQGESTKSLSKESRSNVNKTEIVSESAENVTSSASQEINKSSSNVNPLFVLDIVIKSTYNMYANELRYALIYAVFVEPIEVQTYNLPFVIRTPRATRFAHPKQVPFNIQLREILRNNTKVEKSKQRAKKDRGKKGKSTLAAPVTPPPSLCDEKMLTCNRLFILPLVEANEALEMFEMHTGNT